MRNYLWMGSAIVPAHGGSAEVERHGWPRQISGGTPRSAEECPNGEVGRKHRVARSALMAGGILSILFSRHNQPHADCGWGWLVQCPACRAAPHPRDDDSCVMGESSRFANLLLRSWLVWPPLS